MPVEVKGLSELRRALNKFEPEMKKQLDREIRSFLAPVVKEARAYAPQEIPGLSNWTKAQTEGAKFPRYDVSVVRRGIKVKLGASKRNTNGFKTLIAIVNNSAAGAIFETAGRKNPFGSPKSRSQNPYAGRHFIGAINAQGMMKGKDKERGRLIYRAWDENQGKALANVMRAIYNVRGMVEHDTNSGKWRRVA